MWSGQQSAQSYWSYVVVARMQATPPLIMLAYLERVTDGQEAVIGHDGVEEALSAAQEVEGVELGHTVGKGDRLLSGDTRVISILGTVTVEYHMSMKDGWLGRSTWWCRQDSL